MNKQISLSIVIMTILVSLFAIRIPSAKAQSLNVDAIAVWSHDSGSPTDLFDIYYSIYDASVNTWSSLGPNPTDVIASLPGDDFWPAISFDHMGRAIAVWSHDTGAPSGFDIYYSQWLGPSIGWTAPTSIVSLVDDDIDPAVALWYNGTGVVVWTRWTSGELWYSLWNGVTWGPATWLNSPNPWPASLIPAPYKQPEVAYDANHNAIAIWTDTDLGHVYYSVLFDGAASWTVPADLDPAQPDGVAVESRKGISPDRLGNAKAVWNPESLGWWDNQYSIWNGASFSPAVAIYPGMGIGNSTGLGTAVAFDQTNDATAIHGTDLTLNDIWSNREVGGVWQPTDLVTPVGWDYPGFEPRVAHLRSGNAVAVWTGLGPLEDLDIIYRIWDPFLGTWINGGPIDPAGVLGDDGPWYGPVSIASPSGSPTSPMFIHDVAVTNVLPEHNVAAQGFKVEIDVTVRNEGDVPETFNTRLFRLGSLVPLRLDGSAALGWNNTQPGPTLTVELYDNVRLTLVSADGLPHLFYIDYNGNMIPDPTEPVSSIFPPTTTLEFVANTIGVFTYYCDFHELTMFGTFMVNPPTYHEIGGQLVSLNPGEQRTLVFSWNTAGVPRSRYTLVAAVDHIWPSETDLSDNIFVDGEILISKLGDLNLDGLINYKDASIFRQAYIGEYNYLADFNQDGVINYKDASLFRGYYIAG